jgi:hypothetical protein
MFPVRYVLDLYYLEEMSKIGFAKPVLTEAFHIVHKEEFSVTCYMCDTYI